MKFTEDTADHAGLWGREWGQKTNTQGLRERLGDGAENKQKQIQLGKIAHYGIWGKDNPLGGY